MNLFILRFLKQPKQKNLVLLTDRMEKAQEKIKSLEVIEVKLFLIPFSKAQVCSFFEANKEFLLQTLKDNEENLREALHAKQAMMQSIR